MSDASASAAPAGPRVEDAAVETYRQVPAGFFDGGRLTRQAFQVRTKDSGLLSIALSTKTTADKAFKHYTETLKFKSVAVYAVTVGECGTVNLEVWEDPITDPVPDDTHGIIDFRACVGNKAETKIRETRLVQLAEQRGPVYPRPQ